MGCCVYDRIFWRVCNFFQPILEYCLSKLTFEVQFSLILAHRIPSSSFIIFDKKYFREKVANKNYACCAISALHSQCGKCWIFSGKTTSRNHFSWEWIFVFSTLWVPSFATKYIDNFISHIIHINSSHFSDKKRTDNIELLKQV